MSIDVYVEVVNIFFNYIMSTIVPSPNKLTASFAYPTLQKVSEGDYNGYIQAQK